MQPVQLRKSAGLHFLQISKNGGGRAYGLRLFLQAESVQTVDPKMPLQRVAGRFQFHLPRLYMGDERLHAVDHRGQPAFLGFPSARDQLAGLQTGQFLSQSLFRFSRIVALKLCRGKLPGGNVAVGDTGLPAQAVEQNRHQVVVAVVFQHRRFGNGALGDDLLDLTLHQPRARFADLFGHRHLVACLHQQGEVALDAVIGNARQRNAHIVADRPAGQRHIANLRHNLGIAVEGFVKVAQAKEEDAVRVLALQLQVLTAHRRGHGQVRFSGIQLLEARACSYLCQKTRLLGSP